MPKINLWSICLSHCPLRKKILPGILCGGNSKRCLCGVSRPWRGREGASLAFDFPLSRFLPLSHCLHSSAWGRGGTAQHCMSSAWLRSINKSWMDWCLQIGYKNNIYILGKLWNIFFLSGSNFNSLSRFHKRPFLKSSFYMRFDIKKIQWQFVQINGLEICLPHGNV